MPFDVELILLLEGDETLESALHIKFINLLHRNEWFNYSLEIKEFIKSNLHLNIVITKKEQTRFKVFPQHLIDQVNILYVQKLSYKEISKYIDLTEAQIKRLIIDNHLYTLRNDSKSINYEYYTGKRLRKNALRDYRKNLITRLELQQVYLKYPVKKMRKEIALLVN